MLQVLNKKSIYTQIAFQSFIAAIHIQFSSKNNAFNAYTVSSTSQCRLVLKNPMAVKISNPLFYVGLRLKKGNDFSVGQLLEIQVLRINLQPIALSEEGYREIRIFAKQTFEFKVKPKLVERCLRI